MEGRVRNIVGLVSPHAGYVYSGSAAAWAFDALAGDRLPDTIVILGPNHHGMGKPIAISQADKWSTPLGDIDADLDTANAIIQNSQYAQYDDLAHQREHSIEVQIPFIQYIGGEKTKIVAISISHLNETEAELVVSDLGASIFRALEGKNAVIIASTDFTHYESKANAQQKDSLAIDRILDLDAKGLLSTVYEKSITMCGVIGTAIMIEAAKLLGATKASKLAYYTSGDVTGDIDQVVGYGAMCLSGKSVAGHRLADI